MRTNIYPLVLIALLFVRGAVYSDEDMASTVKKLQVVKLPAERLLNGDIVIVGRLGFPLGRSIKIKGKIVDPHLSEATRATGPLSAGGIFALVMSVNGIGSAEDIVIRLEPYGLNCNKLKAAKVGDIFEMIGYETGEYCGTILSNLKESIQLQPHEVFGFYTRFAVLSLNIGAGEREAHISHDLAQPLDLGGVSGFDSKDGANIRVRPGPNGSKSVYTRSKDKRNVTKISYMEDGSIMTISVYKLDTTEKIVGCLIYDKQNQPLYKVGYGYNGDGQLEGERMWDWRLQKDYRNIYDREFPIQEIYYITDPIERTRQAITLYTLDINIFLRDYGSATTAFDPKMFDEPLPKSK